MLDPSETLDDVGAVVAEVAMKRAARYGRAPVKPDVDLAVSIFGYDGSGDAAWVAKRVMLVLGAAHHYDVRRFAVDLVPTVLLENVPADPAAIATWRGERVGGGGHGLIHRRRMTLALTRRAASLHSQATTSATSAGEATWVWSRSPATNARTSSVIQPVSVTGGCTTLAVMP